MLEQPFHVWDPITDLPISWADLHRTELDLVHEQWVQEKGILRDRSKLHELEERLATLWAIETGVIERLYTIDRGVTETLVAFGLDALESFHQQGKLAQDVGSLIKDQRAALEFVFEFISQKRDLSDSYIKELHQLLTRNQDSTEAVDQFDHRLQVQLRKGAWKGLPNNPTRPDGRPHEYCPPIFVQDEIDQLLSWHRAHVESEVPTDVEAAWLHHRFTQIHPFQDGNGRVARALATMVFLRADSLPLVIRDADHRDTYLNALEAADGGDLSPLVTLFAHIQQQDIGAAIEILRSLRGEGVAQQARSAAERARQRQQQMVSATNELTDRLVTMGTTRLEEVRLELEQQFADQQVSIEAFVHENAPHEEAWWNRQVIEMARLHDYWADLSGHRRWVRLRLRLPEMSNDQTSIVLSFHQMGRIGGLAVVDGFMSTSRIPGAADPSDYADEWDIVSLAKNPFTYSTRHRDPAGGFRTWLESVVDVALDTWQSRI